MMHIIFIVQYFHLKKKTVGTYGYEWVDSDVDTTRRHLVLSVVKFSQGEIDPSYFSIGVEKKTNGNVIPNIYFDFLI